MKNPIYARGMTTSTWTWPAWKKAKLLTIMAMEMDSFEQDTVPLAVAEIIDF